MFTRLFMFSRIMFPKNIVFNNLCLKRNLNAFSYNLDSFLRSNRPITQFNNKINSLKTKNDFRNTEYYLKTLKKNITPSDLGKVYEIINQNNSLIEFNKYNYYKHLIKQTELVSAYLIVWNKNAETNIHTHPSNGCFILNLSGNWEENIYQNNSEVTKRFLYQNNISFINNQVGAHKVKYLYDFTGKIGLSINVYSPTSEIV